LTGEILLALRIVLAFSLFVFFGWVVSVFWRELQTNAALIASRRVPPLALLVEHPGREAEMRNFSDPEVIIGRDPTCELFLEDEVVSSHHARLTYHHSQWWLEDLHSTNGTTLNGELITTATVVIAGDVIGCGSVRLTFILPGKGISPPTLQIKRNLGATDG